MAAFRYSASFPESPRATPGASRHAPQASTSTTASALSFTLSSRDSSSTAYTEDWEDNQSDSLSLYDQYYESSCKSPQYAQELAANDDEDTLEQLSIYSAPSARSSRSKRVASARSTTGATDFAQLLASLQSSSLGRCACGEEPEEDSIYCSRKCAQADALAALCSSSAGDDDSIRSNSTGNSVGSHYRRVEREEKERAYQQQKEKERAADRQARTGAWTNGLARNGSTSSSYKQSTRPPRTSSRRNPSASSASSASSIPSLSSSSSASSARSACSIPAPYDDHPTHGHLFVDALSSPALLDRSTPSPSGRPTRSAGKQQLHPADLIDAEATPRPGAGLGHGRSFTDEEYGVPSADQHSRSGLGYLGMMMLQADDDEEFGDEQEDRVVSFSAQTGKELKERVIRGRGGHQKAKLSFDDVLSVMRG